MWHSVDITRNQNQLELMLDGVLHVSRRFPGTFISFDLKKGEGDVFIGGMLTNGMLNKLSLKTRSSGISFDGCLQEINFNGVDIVEGVVNGEEVFITKGRPRSTCENLSDLDPTTETVASSPPPVTTDKTTTEQLTTFVTSTEKKELPTSYITTPMTTSEDYTHSSQQVLPPHAPSFSGNSVVPCVDDEDDCDSDDSGSGIDEDSSGKNRQSSGDKGTSTSSAKENKVEIPNIIDNKKPVKPHPSKDPLFETDRDELIGEPDISRTNCIQDDEDGCDSEDASGQSSTEIGSGGSALPTTTPSPVNDGTNYAKKTVLRVRKSSAKKWTLIAGIIVVGTLLVAFCIFAIWWLCKHKNDPHWNGSYKGSKERCLQSEVTEV